MESVGAFGLFAVAAMVICYALESRSPRFVLLFSASCLVASIYGFLIGAWPFGLLEAIWSVLAFRRWRRAERIQHHEARLSRRMLW
jgi:hypothetical protein